MPELPEVETVVRGLTKPLVGQTIKDIKKLHPKSLQLNSGLSLNKLKGLKILSIRRQGKAIIINLTKQISLLIHLKMTGQLIYIPATPSVPPDLPALSEVEWVIPELACRQAGKRSESLAASRDSGQARDLPPRLNLGHPTTDFINSMPSKHTRIIFKLSEGTLYFNDQRIFGWVKAMPTKNISTTSFIQNLGPDALDKSFNLNVLKQIIKRKPKSSIKSIILDQSNLAGIGNIYADESLFLAGIKPNRKASTLKQLEIKKLVQNIKQVLKKGIKYSGTSISDYKTAQGATGKMQNYLKVYKRAGLPCKKCNTLIKKIKTASRGTHFCPTCQR